MTKQYEQTAAGAFYAAKDSKALVGTTGADHTGEAAYRPPLGLWDITTPIGGASHSIVFDLKNHASYCAAVWDVRETTATAHAKQADDFSTTVAQATAAATFTTAREKYIFGIQEIVLRLATVAPQSMAMPGPSLLLEPREIDIARIDAGASASINKSAQVPGSTYKLDVMFPGLEPNGIDTSIAKPLPKATMATRLTSLFVTCAGQQIQQPQYQGLMERPCPIRPYTDFLVCQGSLTSTAEVVTPTLKEYSAAPHYLARVVQTPTNAQKEVVVRTQHDGAAAAKTLLLASWHTPAIAMFYDASGLVNQVAVNV